MRLFFAALAVFQFLLSEVHAQNAEFTLVKESDGIFIYERWITFPKTDPPVEAREVKGEFHFNSTIQEAVRLLQDEKNIRKWQSHVSEFHVYLKPDTTHWFEYSYHDIPWPVSDQDHLLSYSMTRQQNGDIYITFESFADEKLAPVREGVTRMKLSGSWTFQKIDSFRVKATYRILSMPLAIPKFLTDPIIRNNMMTTIQEFISIVGKKQIN